MDIVLDILHVFQKMLTSGTDFKKIVYRVIKNYVFF